MDRFGPTANLLFELIKNLNIYYEFERSLKMLEKNMLGNRFLLIIDKNEIKQNPHEKIVDISQQINIPENFLEVFEKSLSDARHVDFGFEEKESTCVYKVYLDFLAKWENEIRGSPNEHDPYLMFLGFKWDAFDNTKHALTRYTWLPSLSFDKIREKLSNIFRNKKYRKPLEIAGDSLDIISRRITCDNVMYLDVTEENSQRRSFDLNMYRAKLQVKEIYPVLLKVYKHYSIPAEKFHALYNPVRTKMFGHLSGGIDREGKDFLTMYYGLEKITNIK